MKTKFKILQGSGMSTDKARRDLNKQIDEFKWVIDNCSAPTSHCGPGDWHYIFVTVQYKTP